MNEEIKPARPGSLLVIFLTVFIDLLGFGMVLPLLPIYADDFATDPSGLMLGLLMASFSIMQFIFAPIWGGISDRVGRRPVLMIGLASSVVFYAIFGVATVYRSLFWIFVSRIGAGIAGATIPTAQAYIADTTTPERRARGMALIGVAFGIGFTFGPLLGFLAVPSGTGNPGPWPGYIASILSAIALGLAFFLLPESLRPNSSSAARKWIDFRAIHNASKSSVILVILAAIFICVFSFANFETTLSMLIKGSKDIENSPFEFGWKEVCLTFAFIGFTLMIIQGGIVRPLSLRIPERPLAIAGGLLEIVGFALVAVAVQQASTPLLYGALVVIVTGFSCLQPTLNSLLSRAAKEDEQGTIMGLGQSVNALARIFGSALGIPLLKIQLTAPYLVGAGLMFIGTLFLYLKAKPAKDSDRQSEST